MRTSKDYKNYSTIFNIDKNYQKLTWVCLKIVYPFLPNGFMIIIPMKNGYFIGKINPTFSDKAIEIVDFPIKNGDFPLQNVSSPEGIKNSLLPFIVSRIHRHLELRAPPRPAIPEDRQLFGSPAATAVAAVPALAENDGFYSTMGFTVLPWVLRFYHGFYMVKTW